MTKTILLTLSILLFSYAVHVDGKEIHTIFNRTEGELGVDDEGTLYWNKKAIVTEQKVKLQWWVNFSIILASFSTLAIAIFTLLQYLMPRKDKIQKD